MYKRGRLLGSFLVVSSSCLYSRIRKRGGNNKETGSLTQLASSTKVNHVTRVTTLQLKQPISFYSVVDGLDCFHVLFKGARDDREVAGICFGLVGVLRE